jgi:hypothetical protein
MLDVFVSGRDFESGKAFVVITDEESGPKYYYSPKQIDELCERMQMAKLQALHGPVEHR